jgi:hypothetical protein
MHIAVPVVIITKKPTKFSTKYSKMNEVKEKIKQEGPVGSHAAPMFGKNPSLYPSIV